MLAARVVGMAGSSSDAEGEDLLEEFREVRLYGVVDSRCWWLILVRVLQAAAEGLARFGGVFRGWAVVTDIDFDAELEHAGRRATATPGGSRVASHASAAGGLFSRVGSSSIVQPPSSPVVSGAQRAPSQAPSQPEEDVQVAATRKAPSRQASQAVASTTPRVPAARPSGGSRPSAGGRESFTPVSPSVVSAPRPAESPMVIDDDSDGPGEVVVASSAHGSSVARGGKAKAAVAAPGGSGKPSATKDAMRRAESEEGGELQEDRCELCRSTNRVCRVVRGRTACSMCGVKHMKCSFSGVEVKGYVVHRLGDFAIADRSVFREKSDPVPIAGGSRKRRRTDGSFDFDGVEMPGFPKASMVQATKDGAAIHYKTRPEVGNTPLGIDRAALGIGSPREFSSLSSAERKSYYNMKWSVDKLNEGILDMGIHVPAHAANRARRLAEEGYAVIGGSSGDKKGKGREKGQK